MNLQFYLEKLFASESFQNFVKEKTDAYFCSGFFCVDKKGKDNKTHIDYYVPSEDKIFSFQLESKIEPMPVDVIEKETPEKIPDNLDFNFNEIENIIKEKMQVEKINNKIEKVLLSLQRVDKKDFLVGTIFISGLGMIKVKVDLDKIEITEFEKKSFFDMVKVLKKN